MVEMDEFGDREMDFAVWDMTDVESGEFQVKHLTHDVKLHSRDQ